MNISTILLISSCVLAFTTAQLSLKSNGVDYTNGNFYAPFGTNFTISCQGGSGAKKWDVIVLGSTVVGVSTDRTAPVFQRSDGQNQELVITNFQDNSQQTYQCRELAGTTPTVTLRVEEGVVILSYSVSTTSVLLLWEPLPDNTVVSGTCCLDKTIPSSCETSSSALNNGSVTISDLEEFTEYVCYINDRSRDVSVMTSSAKPSGPPVDVNLIVLGMTSLQLSWSMPNETERNGIITGYYVECLGEGIPRGPTETGTTTMTFSNLPHHTMYACRVAAVNVKGTGPYSMYTNITTPQGAPGQVVVTVSKVDNNVRVIVSWSLPNPLNGVVTRYTVIYREHDSQDDNTLNTNESTRDIEISGLVPGVPYSVVVIAETGGGAGEESERTLFFSKELMPTVAVSGVSVERLSSSEMMVSWTSLTPREARGFPVYTVTYTPTGTSGRVPSQAQSQQTQQNSTTINNLMEDATYSVVIGVSTAGGSGPDSTPVDVPLFTTPPTVDLPSSTEPPPTVGIVIAVVIIVVLIMLVATVLVAIVVYYQYRKRNQPSENDVDYTEGGNDVKLQKNPAYDTVQLSGCSSSSAPEYENVQLQTL